MNEKDDLPPDIQSGDSVLRCLGAHAHRPDMPVKNKCAHEGCDKSPLWMPEVRAWAKGFPTTPGKCAKALVGVGFCDEHKNDWTREMCTPVLDAMDAMCKHLGKCPVDRTTFQIHLEPVLMTQSDE